MSIPEARHKFAVFTSAFTFFVIIAGGTVTSTGSGLSVPDWPLSFGHLMPRMVGGVFFEHGHRMVAAMTGCLITILALWTSRAESRPWVRTLGWAGVGTVVAQGLLGGLTVLLRLPASVSSSHAAIAQLTFCLTVAMALVTSPAWLSPPPPILDERAPRLRVLAPLTTAVIYVQILMGAVMPHTGAGLSIPDFPLCFGSLFPTPDTWTPAVLINFAHRVGACLVLGCIILLAWRTFKDFGRQEWVTRPVRFISILVGLQILLGGSIIWTGRLVILTVAHVATGALLLGTSLLITLRVYRLTSEARLADSGAPAPAPWREGGDREMTSVGAVQ